MKIAFYLNNEAQTEIMQFRELISNPFNIGDELNLNVKDIHHLQLRGKNHYENLNAFLTEDNNKLKDQFHLKTVKIISEYRHIDLNSIDEPKLTIEYYCTFIP